MDKGKDPVTFGTDPVDVPTSVYQDESPNQIKSQIDQTRAEMDGTLNALIAELNPRHLLDDFVDSVKCRLRGTFNSDQARLVAKKAGRSAVDAVKDHPIPVALAGAGLAYLLFFEGKEKSKYRSPALPGDIYGGQQPAPSLGGVEASMASYEGMTEYGALQGGSCGCGSEFEADQSFSEQSFTDKAKDKVSGAASAVSGAAGSLRDKAADAAQSAKDTAAGALGSVKETAGSMKDSAAQAVGSIRDTARDTAASLKDSAVSTVQTVKSSTTGAMSKLKDVASSAASSTKRIASGTACAVRGTAHGVGSAASRVGQFAGSMKDTMISSAGAVKDRTGDLAVMIGEKAKDLGHDISVGAVEAGHLVKSTAVGVSRQARHGYDVSRRKAVEVSEEHPVALGAALLGLGVLVGLSLPRSRKEDEVLGEKADDLKSRAKQTGKQLISRGMHIAQVTAEETIDEAKRQGLTPSAIAEKARRIASEIKDKAGEVVQREELTPDALGDKVKAVAEHAKDTAQQELGQQQKDLQEATA